MARMARVVEDIGRYRTGKDELFGSGGAVGDERAAFSATAQGRGGDRHSRRSRASGRRATIDEFE